MNMRGELGRINPEKAGKAAKSLYQKGEASEAKTRIRSAHIHISLLFFHFYQQKLKNSLTGPIYSVTQDAR